VVIDEEEVGEIEDICEEWHDGVFNADSPAESAICSRGTEGRARRLLCVDMKRFASIVHRDSLYSSYSNVRKNEVIAGHSHIIGCFSYTGWNGEKAPGLL